MTHTRTNCLEVPTNDAERALIASFAKQVGMAAAVFARFTMLQYIDLHDAKKLGQEESRPCRDAPVASRASAKNARVAGAVHQRRGGFGSAPRPIRV